MVSQTEGFVANLQNYLSQVFKRSLQLNGQSLSILNIFKVSGQNHNLDTGNFVPWTRGNTKWPTHAVS